MIGPWSGLLRRWRRPNRRLALLRRAGPALVWRDHVVLTQRLFLLGQARHARHRGDDLPALLPRDGVMTLMLGSLSMALGIVVGLTTFVGMVYGPAAPWTEPCTVWSGSVFDPPSWSRPVAVAVVSIPTQYSLLLGLVGAVLGAVGMVARRRGRHVSGLCALGVVLCLASFMVPFVGLAVLNLMS